MAHNLEFDTNGSAKMFYAKRDGAPWHKLGKEIDTNAVTSVDDIMAQIGANHTFTMQDIYTANGIKLADVCPDRCLAVVRDDGHVAGVVGRDYTIAQPVEKFQWAQPFIDQKLMHPTAGGWLHNNVLWFQCKVSNSVSEVVPGDPLELYVLCAGGYDGKFSVFFGPNGHRAVCQNTLMPAIGESTVLKFRHTKSVNANLKSAQDTIGVALKNWTVALNTYRALSKAEIEDGGTIKKYVNAVFRVQEKKNDEQERIDAAIEKANPLAKIDPMALLAQVRAERTVDAQGIEIVDSILDKQRKCHVTDEITALYENGAGTDVPGVKGTWWGLYNAATEYMTHERGRSDESRFATTLLGAGNGMAKRALDVAVEMGLNA